MISFFKNNLSFIFNIALLVLLFTYPITNITEAGKKEKNEKLSETVKTNNAVIENTMNIDLKNSNHFIGNPI